MPPWNRPNSAEITYSDTQPVERQEEQQRQALQHRAEQQRAQAADAVADDARDQPADDAAGQHQRQHLGAARGAVAEVGAVGDDVDLRHRHRDAAGDAGDAEQRLRVVHAQAERRGSTPAAPALERVAVAGRCSRRTRPHQQREQRHRHDAEDAEADVGLAPADDLDEVLHDRRPDRAGEVVAARADRDRDAAPAHEPERRVGDQRRESRRAAEQRRAEAPCTSTKLPRLPRTGRRRRSRRRAPTAPIRTTSITPRRSASWPISDAAEAEADHHQRVWQRGVGARRRRTRPGRRAARPRRRTSRCCRSSSARA